MCTTTFLSCATAGLETNNADTSNPITIQARYNVESDITSSGLIQVNCFSERQNAKSERDDATGQAVERRNAVNRLAVRQIRTYYRWALYRRRVSMLDSIETLLRTLFVTRRPTNLREQNPIPLTRWGNLLLINRLTRFELFCDGRSTTDKPILIVVIARRLFPDHVVTHLVFAGRV